MKNSAFKPEGKSVFGILSLNRNDTSTRLQQIDLAILLETDAEIQHPTVQIETSTNDCEFKTC